MLTMVALMLSLLDQSAPPIRILNPTNNQPNPGDMRLAEFDTEIATGSNWRVFSVNSFPKGPLVITQVAEVRQQNPPSTWAVYVGNRDYLPVNSLTLAAAVVDVNGKVKATQTLAPIKNLKPQQVSRKEIPIRVTIVAPTDRVVFYVKEVKSETADWKSADVDVAELIKAAAHKLPVP